MKDDFTESTMLEDRVEELKRTRDEYYRDLTKARKDLQDFRRNMSELLDALASLENLPETAHYLIKLNHRLNQNG